MPLLIYGAELKNEEEEITIDNFANLIDDTSWEEFMPKGVDKEKFEKFKKYYDPDIFREAGKRIREMARAADKFTIEERIERISAIFNTFRNPDKETVLTPWRVVNMHMSDCLGGWCFYGESFGEKDTLSVPRFVDRGKVTQDVFRPEAHILEINSKSGLYPLYVAYNIYRSRVEKVKAKYGEIGHAFAMSLWDATIEENILVVCKTPMAKSITKRTLAGFRDTKVNAQYYPNLIENITERPDAVVNTFRDGKHFWKINENTSMKLDAIVGNPPYQQMDGGGKGSSSTSLFDKFVDISFKLNPHYCSMIIPSRWFSGGKGLDDFRERTLHDTRICLIRDFFDSTYCFPTADISGGICYFLWDSKYNGDCTIISERNGQSSIMKRPLLEKGCDAFVRFNESVSIIRKVRIKEEKSIETIISARKPFGEIIPNSTHKENSVYVYAYPNNGYYSRFDVEQNTNWINSYKVFVTKAYGERGDFPYYVIGKPFIGKPNEICTETYLVVTTTDNNEVCANVISYMKTKFFRFLVLQKKNTQNAARNVYTFAPIQDFTRPWTDEELYKKYNLDENEIAFIESMIKPME